MAAIGVHYDWSSCTDFQVCVLYAGNNYYLVKTLTNAPKFTQPHADLKYGHKLIMYDLAFIQGGYVFIGRCLLT